MQKRVEFKDDKRRIIFYSFESASKLASAESAGNDPAALAEKLEKEPVKKHSGASQ